MDGFAQLPGEERRAYLEEAAARMGLSIQIIEKDFWVCWTLKELFALPGTGETLIFKGGTSLSKVYRQIERFSEDVDVSIDRASLGFAGDHDPEAKVSGKERRRRIDDLREACRKKVAEEIQPALAAVVRSKLGQEGWTLQLDTSDTDLETLLFAYPSSGGIPAAAYIAQAVKIEMGARSDNWPNQQSGISPYVADQIPAAFKAPDVPVKVLSVERTFWDKATVLHAEYHRPPDKPIRPRCSRHYYDVSRLIASGVGDRAAQDLALLERVVEHTKAYFPSGWARYDEARKGSLRLLPAPARMKDLEQDYEKMREMFFGERPSFADVLQATEEWEQKFNHG